MLRISYGLIVALALAGTVLAAVAGEDFPAALIEDWLLQDAGPRCEQCFDSATNATLEAEVVGKALSEVGDAAGLLFRREVKALCEAGVVGRDPRWRDVYLKACEMRRAARLKPLLAAAPKIVFVKRQVIRPSFFAYTEGQSDAQQERHFHPGSSLCLLEMDGGSDTVRTLLEDKAGSIRDPCVSYNGRCVLFAWKKSLNEDDYHLYELDVSSGAIRQITSGLGFADYEPCYLPNGDIVFASTRCVQTTDCFWTEVSNLYTCDKDGRFLRRLGFDQVHTVYPAVTDDGRVTYTRWDYNDRGQVYPQALFQMNADGTGQAALYGNNSWFPTTIAHARNIPGTQKLMAILCGHHSPQTGKLAIIDPTKGREENTGVQLIAPVRETPAVRVDAYGQEGELFAYPYPLDEEHCIVACAPLGWAGKGRFRQRTADFGLYALDAEGRRELLASDAALPCLQPFPLAARARPHSRPSLVDYRKTTGTYYVQDVYQGPGLEGVPRGTIKRLRVVTMDFRAAGIGHNGSGGPGGGALSSTPVSIGNGAWDVKTVLGDAEVREDGSAFFVVPARTPVYFQALDGSNRVVQTMRSWSTLQPGENQSCTGCHEPKNSTPPSSGYRATLALQTGARPLIAFYGPPRGFSFAREIQPILDRHCISCHDDRTAAARLFTGEARLTGRAPTNATGKAFSLLGAAVEDITAKRKWSDAYLVLTQSRPDERQSGPARFRGEVSGPIVHWVGSQSAPPMLPPYAAGSTKSGLIPLLESGHGGAKLTREDMDKIACWIDLLVPFCGDYTEASAWTDAETAMHARYLAKRKAMEETERKNIDDFIRSR